MSNNRLTGSVPPAHMCKARLASGSAGLLLILAWLLAGCAGSERTAYQTIGAAVVSVDGAMKGWADWVNLGHATPEQADAVRAAYEDYQAAMYSARIIQQSLGAHPENHDAFEHALADLSAASLAVVELIANLTEQKP